MSRVGKGRENTVRRRQVGSIVEAASGPTPRRVARAPARTPHGPETCHDEDGRWRMMRIQRERPTLGQPPPSPLSRLDHDRVTILIAVVTPLPWTIVSVRPACVVVVVWRAKGIRHAK